MLGMLAQIGNNKGKRTVWVEKGEVCVSLPVYSSYTQLINMIPGIPYLCSLYDKFPLCYIFYAAKKTSLFTFSPALHVLGS